MTHRDWDQNDLIKSAAEDLVGMVGCIAATVDDPLSKELSESMHDLWEATWSEMDYTAALEATDKMLLAIERHRGSWRSPFMVLRALLVSTRAGRKIGPAEGR